ncbi:hypothetical protein HF086_010636 [Spodoptera exigua]|uniref:Transferrin-like domain-containing protein n=1 Tax=Spodoptera exigua TaxID=7107 RepID=A0A922MUU0_SPOEX|nr:hypothetical protein HF086_010636 [Spodoptera exigua]
MDTYLVVTLSSILIGTTSASIYGSENAINGINKVPKIEGQDIITWCTTSLLENQKCEKLAQSVLQDKGLFGKDFIELKCKRAFDTEECMSWVDRGEASLLGLDAGEVYVAGRYHSLVPILQELYGASKPYQYSIAVVRKGALPSIQPGYGLSGLRGAKACFPGVGALAGWVMPIHVLMQEGGLKITDCNNHVKSAIEFFGDSCAPNSLKDMYNPIGDNSDKLCKLCAGGAGIRCTLADPYAGYEGALRCLIANNSGDIAFVRDTTVQHALLSHQILGGVTEDQFEIICRDGSRRPVTDSENCNWGRVPADAIVTSSAVSMEQRKKYQDYLQVIYQLYGEPNPLNKIYNNITNGVQPGGYNPYSSTESSRYPYETFNRDNRFNNNFNNRQNEYEEDMNNKASTMPPFKNRVDSSGQPIESIFQLFRSNETTDLLLQVALKAAFLSPTLVCWRGHSTRHCERAIAEGAADFALFDSADMLHAANMHRLVPFMQEIYSSGDNWYYAVAVAKEQDPDTDLTYLRGKNACHTGLGTAAGWVSYGCDGAHAAAEYFTKSCAPGALSAERCRRDASEDYFGHVGAVRCMVEGGGDVAFVRHSAPAEVSAGRRREWWARDLLPDDLQLLCPDGTRAKMHEYKHCNLGKVPGSVLMGRPNHTELDTYSNLMVYAQQFYGAVTTDEFSFSMFYSQPPYSDLIFSDVAVRLKPLAHNKRSAEIVAGPALIRAARIVSCDAPQASYYVASDPDFLSHAYSNGVMGHLLAISLFLLALLR